MGFDERASGIGMRCERDDTNVFRSVGLCPEPRVGRTGDRGGPQRRISPRIDDDRLRDPRARYLPDAPDGASVLGT